MIKAKKHYGQNFLKDRIVLNKIIQSMPNNNLKVVEIGPGLGDLTKKLLEHKKSVRAFEIDDELCNLLKKQFSLDIKEKRFCLNCIDVLQYWKDTHLINEDYNLVANLPYYIATKIILKSFRDDHCKNILVMIQKEVAQKFVAKVGEREYSALSVLAEILGNASVVCEVAPESFKPPPKVFSAILRIEKKENIFDKKEFEEFERFLRVCFSSPRKTLFKNLSSFKKEKIKNIFSILQIEQNLRPHQLSSIKYLEIFKLLRNEDARQTGKKVRAEKEQQ